MVAEDGKRCSDIGKLNLNNKNECRWAARNRRIGNKSDSKGAFNGFTFDEKGMAKGCSVDGEFRWNKHPVGERGGRSVCLRSGECVSLIIMKWQIFLICYIDLILLAHFLVFFQAPCCPQRCQICF